jgi:hypothetical protein
MRDENKDILNEKALSFIVPDIPIRPGEVIYLILLSI